MAPTVDVMKQQSLQEPLVKQSLEEPLVKRSRKDSEECPPKEVQSASSFSSCTTQKDSSKEEDDEEEEEVQSVCVTPKSKKHRIPVVDIDLCPPAPKKPRRLTCSSERGASNFLQKLSFSRTFLC